MGSHWAFTIDTHAHTIFDDMDGSTFEHSVDCLEPLWISTRCDAPLTKLGHIPYFVDDIFCICW